MSIEDSTVLYELAIRSDNLLLGLLSRTPSWKHMTRFANETYFWYQRTEYLVGRSLTPRQINWKTVYYNLQQADVISDQRRKYNIFVDEVLRDSDTVTVAIELGYQPENRHLVTCCVEGYIETVKLLLQQPGIDPAYENSRPILAASVNDHIDVVRLLLEDGRANPTNIKHDVLIFLIGCNEIEWIKKLLSRRDITLVDSENTLLGFASGLGRIEIMKLLLADPRIDPSNLDYHRRGVLSEAVDNGQLEAVTL